MRKRTKKERNNMKLSSCTEFYFSEGISYRNPLDMPDSDYYPAKSKGNKIPGQSVGNLKVPGHGVN